MAGVARTLRRWEKGGGRAARLGAGQGDRAPGLEVPPTTPPQGGGTAGKLYFTGRVKASCIFGELEVVRLRYDAVVGGTSVAE